MKLVTKLRSTSLVFFRSVDGGTDKEMDLTHDSSFVSLFVACEMGL